MKQKLKFWAAISPALVIGVLLAVLTVGKVADEVAAGNGNMVLESIVIMLGLMTLAGGSVMAFVIGAEKYQRFLKKLHRSAYGPEEPPF